MSKRIHPVKLLLTDEERDDAARRAKKNRGSDEFLDEQDFQPSGFNNGVM